MRKMVSIFMVLAMLLTLAPMNIFAADSDKAAFSDMKSTDYYAQAAIALEELGIIAGYPDGTYGAEKSISRAEMAAIVCRMLDKEAEAEKAKGETAFDDVAADHWASGYINIASGLSIINGDGDGKFRPNDDVKYEEAIKMLVCALGYAEDVKLDAADWSKAYIEIAEKKGITSDLKGKKGEAATRADIAVMSYNALATEGESSKIPATPIASVKGGEYKATQKVKLTTATKDAEIYYTTDGTTPTVKSTKYTKEISVSKTVVLKAIAVKNGIASKNVMSVEYTIAKASSGGGGGGGSSSSSSSSKKNVTGAELQVNATAVSKAKVGDVLTLAVKPAKATGTVTWTVGGNKIENASATYTVTAMDMGKTVKAEFTGTGSYKGVASAECEVEKTTQVSAKDIMTDATDAADKSPVVLTDAENTVFYNDANETVEVTEATQVTVSIENSERTTEEIEGATADAKEKFAAQLEIESASVTDVAVTAVDVNLSVDEKPVHPVGSVTVTFSAQQLGLSEDADLSTYIFSANHTNKNGDSETKQGTVVVIDGVQYVRFELNGLSTIWVGNIPPKTVRFYNAQEDAEGKENCIGTVTVRFGDEMKPENIPAPSRPGYIFCGWSYDISGKKIIAELYIYASWVEGLPGYNENELTRLEGVVTNTFLGNEKVDKNDDKITIDVRTVNGMSYKALADAGFDYDIMNAADQTLGRYEIAAGVTGAEDYLGYAVVAFVQNFEKGSDKLVAIAPQADKNKVLELSFDSFAEDGFEKKNGYISFEYFANADDENTTVGKISPKNGYVDYYFNGVYEALDEYEVIALLEYYCPDYTYEEGTVKLVDNTGDGYFDCILIEEVGYECVVESITAEKFQIKDMINDRTITLDPTDKDAYVKFYKNGAQVEFSEIAKGDTLSIVCNGETLKNSTVIKVYISSDKVEGFVSAASAYKNEYKIGGKAYAKSAANNDSIHRSDEGIFYLNYRGRIAYMETVDPTEGNYGFLLAVNTEEDFSEGLSYTLRFMNKEGEWVDAKLYERLAIYDSEGELMAVYRDYDALKDNIEDDTRSWLKVSSYGELELDGALSQRIFRYALNSDGEITAICLPYSGLNEDEFSYENFSGAEYNKTQNKFDGIEYEGGVDEDTIVFAIDAEDSIQDVAKKTQVALLTSALFEDEAEYNGYAYDYDDGTYKCMVITNAKLDEGDSDEGSTGDEGSDVGVEATDGNYGFLFAVDAGNEFDDNPRWTLRFMNKEGNWTDAKLNGKLELYDADGTRVHKFKNTDDVYEWIEEYTDGWLIYGGNFDSGERIFKYALNSEGEITAIRRLGDAEVDDLGDGINENTLIFAIDTDDFGCVKKKNQVALLTSAALEDEAEYEGYAYDLKDSAYKCVVITNAELEEGGSDDDGSDEGVNPSECGYGFLLSVNTEESFADGLSYTLRFMNEAGEWIDAKLYERLTIYDSEGTQIVKFKDYDDIEANITSKTSNWLTITCNELELDGAKTQRVFKYTLNSNGEITNITLPAEGLVEDKFTYQAFGGTSDDDKTTYKESSNSFTNLKFKGGVDEETVVFKIDVADDDITNVTKKKEVALVTSALFRDEGEYGGFAYDFDGDNYKCMVITDAGSKIDEKDSLLVISYAVLCSDGYDEFFEIKGYKDGEEVTLETVPYEELEIYDINGEEYDINDFEWFSDGSVAEISIDWTGKVDCVRVLFETEDAEYGDGAVTGDIEYDAAYVWGTIASKKATGSGKVITLAEGYNWDDAQAGLADTLAEIATAGAGMKGNIYVVEQGARKIKISVDTSIEDYLYLNDDAPEDGDTVYVAYAKLYDGDTIDIVVYEIEYEA